MDSHKRERPQAVRKLKSALRHLRKREYKIAVKRIESALHDLEKCHKPKKPKACKKTINNKTVTNEESITIKDSFNKIYLKINECKKPNTPSLVSHKFFSKVSSGIAIGNDLSLSAGVFVDDQGNPITTFPTTYQYFNLFINGMIQENGVADITGSRLLIKGGALLDVDDPVTLEFVSTV